MNHVTALVPPRTDAAWRSLVTISLVTRLALGFFIGFAVPYLADFEVDGRRYGVFAHDWRVESAEQWLRLKAERALPHRRRGRSVTARDIRLGGDGF
jgi:hypothetical protein